MIFYQRKLGVAMADREISSSFSWELPYDDLNLIIARCVIIRISIKFQAFFTLNFLHFFYARDTQLFSSALISAALRPCFPMTGPIFTLMVLDILKSYSEANKSPALCATGITGYPDFCAKWHHLH